MKIVVIGGTGNIGSKLVNNLKQRGHETLAAAPATGVNTISGEGLDHAMNGSDIVVDVANSPSFSDQAAIEFFEAAGRNLVAAEKNAGTKHHVTLSIVGSDRLQDSGYMRAKVAQENAIRKSGIPYTIVRSTQFFEFVPMIAQGATSGPNVLVSDLLIQPILSDEVAQALTDVALGNPKNGVIEIAGPDRFKLTELLDLYLRAAHDSRTVVFDKNYSYFGARDVADSLVPKKGARIAKTRYLDWIPSHLTGRKAA